MTVNGGVSYWWSDLGGVPARRPALAGDLEADVCIVGGGYTGLWAAYYVKRMQPSLDVVVVEREFAGFGASGRNGGWLTAALPGSRAVLAKGTAGRAGVVAFEAELRRQVEEVIAVCAAEGIDADIVKGGELTVATTPAQRGRLRSAYEQDREWDIVDDQWLDAAEASTRIAIDGLRAAIWTPHCARVHPGKLVRGLANVVEQQGVSIYEDTAVTSIEPHAVRTDRGTVRARNVLRCTEGFTAALPGQRRTWLPMNSSMIVTDPLPADAWERIGWSGREVLGDQAHVYIYAQRTADDRIAIGGRGVPYRYGSQTDNDGTTHEATVTQLTEALGRLLPAARGVPIAHAWSGVLGVPRDWTATVSYDRTTGVGYSGGYVGHGVTAASLGGRTLAELVCAEGTERTTMPWVDRKVRRWEPEPLRWIGVRGLYTAYREADKRELATGRSSAVARVADVVSRKP